MEHCSKCNGVMLEMKVKKTLTPDREKKQVFKCSRCGYYQEKQQVFLNDNSTLDRDPYILRHRPEPPKELDS